MAAMKTLPRTATATTAKTTAKTQPKPAQPKAAASAKALRSDGLEARTRLMDAALALFADKGYANTSTREIALAAQVNIASISYYFGDKAGLYRAVFTDPRRNPHAEVPGNSSAPPDLATSLRALMVGFTQTLKQGDMVQCCMKLHFREMLEPTGVWQDEIDNNIRPAHQALVQVLCQHLGLKKADDDIHRLAFSLAGLGIMLHVGGDVVRAIHPAVMASPNAIDQYTERLLEYALAMVQAEARRRA